MAWILYHKDGTNIKDTNGKIIEINSLDYSGEWMGQCSVTTSIENEAPIEFAIGDYLEYRGEIFELNYEPGKLKQARKNSVGDAFKYDSIKWNSLSDELARVEFLDVVLYDNELHYTALPKFVFYIETLDDLLDRLQANMNEQVGEGKWCFYSRNWARSEQRGGIAARWEEIYGGKAGLSDTGVEDNVIDSASISIDNQSVWEGLSLVNSQFDINFVIRNREVFVGTAGLPTRNVFKYGKGNGLYEIEQNTETDQKIVTRLRAYGSDKNLPTRYYATLNLEVWGNVPYCGLVDGDNFEFGLDLEKSQIGAFFHTVIEGKPGYYAVRAKIGNVTFDAEVVEGDFFLKVFVFEKESQSHDFLSALREMIVADKRVYFVSGVNKDNFPLTHKDYATQNLPDNMSCDRLMLPGFPNESLDEWWQKQTKETQKRLNPTGANLRFSTRKDRPWVESAQSDRIGVRSGSVYFDTDDVKNKIEDIFPTLKEMTINGKRVDVIFKGSEIKDNGVFKEGQEIPSFKIILDEAIDFDINDLKDSDFSVVMTDGMCAGRTFKVGGSVRENGHWVLTMQRTEDGGIYYPYKDFQINAGDHYVLTGISLPDEYVEAASEKLLQYAIIWLLANDHTRRSYAPKIDEIFMARQHDTAIKDETGVIKSLHNTLKEGDIMQFEDEDLGIDGQVVIDTLTIKESEGNIPTYEVTLRDDKEVGTLQKMQNQIDSFVSGNGKGGGMTGSQVKELIQSEGTKYFLSKLKADMAQDIIRFFKGLTLGAVSDENNLGISSDGIATLKEVISSVFSSGALGSGFKLGTYGDTEDSYLEVDRILVRKVAEFVALVIRELRSVGGEIILSPASMKCTRVVAYSKGDIEVTEENGLPIEFYRCYFQQEADGKAVTNDFVMNDLVRCQQFNIKEDVTPNAKNRYYWRKCVGKGDDFIDLSALDYDTDSDIPQAGDEMVQLGNTTDDTRQSAIILSAYGDDAPSIKLYRGINSYSLANHKIVVLSRKEVLIIADKLCYRNTENSYASVADVITNLNVNTQGIQSSVESLKTTQNTQGTSIMQLSSRVKQTETEISQKVSKEYVDGQVKTLSSEITQTATQIGIKVGYTVAERRNLLVGSMFRKQDEGCYFKNAAIYRTSAHEGANVIFADKAASGGAQWGESTTSQNIRLVKGKTYTLSFWARTTSNNVTILGEVCWHDSATDTSRPAGYTGPNRSANLGTEVITPNDGWHLYQRTFTVASNASYEWVSVGCVKAQSSTASQQVYIAHPILIEGTASDFVCWSASPNDFDYIGGNLLNNTRTMSIGGNLKIRNATIATEESYNKDCSVIYANAPSAYVDMAWWSVSDFVKSGTDYLFSFMAKGDGDIGAYMWNGTNLNIFAEDSEHDVASNSTDGLRTISLTSQWKKYWVHWRSEGSGLPGRLLIRCMQGGTAWITMPKLEEGATPTDWIESTNGYVEKSTVTAKLLQTGFDIENGKIIATADKFEVRNNNGDITSSVNEKGVLEVSSGLFTGFVKKKPTVITPDNFDFYKSARSLQAGYVEMDFEKTGSFLVFQGDFSAKLGSNYIALTLPCTTGTAWTTTDYTNSEHPLAYIGQRFVLVNQSTNNNIQIAGGGTIRKNGSGTTGVYNNIVEKGEVAVIECALTTSYSTSGNTYKAAWNGTIYKQ